MLLISHLYTNKGFHDFYFNLEIHVNKLEVSLCDTLYIYILYVCTCEAHNKDKQLFRVDRANLAVACRRAEQNLLLITVESPKKLFFG